MREMSAQDQLHTNWRRGSSSESRKRSIRGSGSSSPKSSSSVVCSNHVTVHTHTELFRDVCQQTARWVSTADVGACARVRAQLRPAYPVERTKPSSARRAWKEASEQAMLWGTLDNLDMDTSHPVLTVRPGSPTLQAILTFEDTPVIYFRNYSIGQRRAGFSGDGPPASQGTTK